MLNVELSAIYRKEVRALQGQCWRNAVLTLVSLDVQGIKAFYVEGVATPHFAPLPYEHGWVELPDDSPSALNGTIIDVTWNPGGTAYYPVHRYTMAEVQRLVGVRSTLPFYDVRKDHKEICEIMDKLYLDLVNA